MLCVQLIGRLPHACLQFLSLLHALLGRIGLMPLAYVQALHALCALTERDVRSCLNTLQLLARRHARIQEHHIEAAALGHKDVTRSIFAIWQALLTGAVRSLVLIRLPCVCCALILVAGPRPQEAGTLH